MSKKEKKAKDGRPIKFPSDSHLPLRSFEVMAQVMIHGDGERFANLFGVSPQHINSMKKRHESEGNGASGKYNPLDQIRAMIWEIQRVDGSTVRAYPFARYILMLIHSENYADMDDEVMAHASRVLKDTGELIEGLRQAWYVDTPREITPKEHAQLTDKLMDAISAIEQLKSWVENNATK